MAEDMNKKNAGQEAILEDTKAEVESAAEEATESPEHEAAETPEEEAAEHEVGGEEAGNEEAKGAKPDPRDAAIEELRKQLAELTGHIKSVGRSPEHSAFAKAYPHLGDKYEELSDKAVKFADEAVGREHESWGKIANAHIRALADSHPKADAVAAAKPEEPALVAKETKVEKPKDTSKKPVGASPITKPKPQPTKKGPLSDEDKIRLLKSGR